MRASGAGARAASMFAVPITLTSSVAPPAPRPSRMGAPAQWKMTAAGTRRGACATARDPAGRHACHRRRRCGRRRARAGRPRRRRRRRAARLEQVAAGEARRAGHEHRSPRSGSRAVLRRVVRPERRVLLLHRPPPPLVGRVPLDRLAQPVVKIHLRRPAQRPRLGRVERSSGDRGPGGRARGGSATRPTGSSRMRRVSSRLLISLPPPTL